MPGYSATTPEAVEVLQPCRHGESAKFLAALLILQNAAKNYQFIFVFYLLQIEDTD
jgi:hypothetical protein